MAYAVLLNKYDGSICGRDDYCNIAANALVVEFVGGRIIISSRN